MSLFLYIPEIENEMILFFQQLFEHKPQGGIIFERLRKAGINRDPIIYKVVQRIIRFTSRNVHEEFFDGFVQDSVAGKRGRLLLRGGGGKGLVIVGKRFVGRGRNWRNCGLFVVLLGFKVTGVAIV